MQNNKHDHWRIPVASGIGGFIGAWISLLIPSSSIWMTMLALIIGAGAGWLIAYLSYDLPKVWQSINSAFQEKSLETISWARFSAPAPSLVNLIVLSLVVTTLGPPIILGWLFGSLDFGFCVLVLTIFSLFGSLLLFNNFRLDPEPGTREIRWHLFEDNYSYAYYLQEVSKEQMPRVVTHLLWTSLAGMCKGLLYFVWLAVVACVFIILAIPMWLYQLIKIINCQQRVAAGFGGFIGTIAGFFFQAPHIGFMTGAISGWLGWYVLDWLPGVSVKGSIGKTFKDVIFPWMKDIIQIHLPPGPIPMPGL